MDRLLAWKFSLPVTHFLAQHFGQRLRGVTQLSGLSVNRDNGHFVVILGKALSWLVTGFLVLYFVGYVSGVLEQLEVGDVYWQLVIRCRSDFGQNVAYVRPLISPAISIMAIRTMAIFANLPCCSAVSGLLWRSVTLMTTNKVMNRTTNIEIRFIGCY